MSYEPLQDLDLDLEDDLAIASPARRTQRLGSRADGTAAAAGSPSPRPAAASAGTSREARAAAALARLAPAASSGDVKVDPDSGTLKQKCLVEKEREWQRFVERQLVGPNTYLQAETVISMLLRITGNIVAHPDDPAFRSIKATSKKLKSDVLDISGGRDALVQLGFRTKAVDFVQQWVFDPALFSPSSLGADKGGRITYLELLKIGHACLKSKEALIKERADKGRENVKSLKEEQAEVRARTLAAIEDDRDRVAKRAAAEAARRS